MESPAGLASDQIDAAAADADTITKVQLYAIEALPFDIGQKWRHEIHLVIEVLMWYFYLWRGGGRMRPTPGQELYNVRYDISSSKSKILFLLLGPILSYGSANMRERTGSRLLDYLKLVHWVSFIGGLPGVSADPIATVLGIKNVQIDPQAQRVHQLEYFHRYLLVRHLTELLIAVWPLVSNTPTFKRISRKVATIGRKPLEKTSCGLCGYPAQVGSRIASPCGCRICHYCWYSEEVTSRGPANCCPACGHAACTFS